MEVVECCLLERDALAYHSALAAHEQRHVTQQLLTSDTQKHTHTRTVMSGPGVPCDVWAMVID